MTEQQRTGLLKIRSHFGENDKTAFEHWAFDFLDVLIKGEGSESYWKKETVRLKELIKEGFIALNQEWKKPLGQIDKDWEKFKKENNLESSIGEETEGQDG